CSPGNTVAAGHIRIGAMVDVQQCALRTFKQQTPPCFASPVQLVRYVCHHRLEFSSQGHSLVTHFIERNSVGTEIACEHKVMEVEQFLELGVECLRIVKILHAQRSATDLVLVGRADTPSGRTNLAIALTSLTSLVESDVV